jgi:hypothetical protein
MLIHQKALSSSISVAASFKDASIEDIGLPSAVKVPLVTVHLNWPLSSLEGKCETTSTLYRETEGNASGGALERTGPLRTATILGMPLLKACEGPAGSPKLRDISSSGIWAIAVKEESSPRGENTLLMEITTFGVDMIESAREQKVIKNPLLSCHTVKK